VEYWGPVKSVLEKALAQATMGQVIVTLGAGDISKISQELVK
jgi:UDP-N-acetylmuramate-alanine ligase